MRKTQRIILKKESQSISLVEQCSTSPSDIDLYTFN